MGTLMMDRPCSHCGARMRWDSDPEEQCWKCFGPEHKGQSGPHREFESDKQICHCPECFARRRSEKAEPLTNRSRIPDQ